MCSGLFRKVKSSRNVSLRKVMPKLASYLSSTSDLPSKRDTQGMIFLPEAVLFLAQPMVVVEELAVACEMTLRLALAADAAAAEIGRIDAGRLDRFEQALLFADADRACR